MRCVRGERGITPLGGARKAESRVLGLALPCIRLAFPSWRTQDAALGTDVGSLVASQGRGSVPSHGTFQPIGERLFQPATAVKPNRNSKTGVAGKENGPAPRMGAEPSQIRHPGAESVRKGLTPDLVAHRLCQQNWQQLLDDV